MENYFQKHSSYIKELQTEITQLKEELAKAKSAGQKKSLPNLMGNSLSQYISLTRHLMKEKGIDKILSFSFIYYTTRFTLLLPIRTANIITENLWQRLNQTTIFEYCTLKYAELRFLTKKSLKGKPKQINKIGIFIPTLEALAGAERYTLMLTQSIKEASPGFEIDIISTNIFTNTPTQYDIPTTEEIRKKLGIDLNGINFRYLILDYQTTNGLWVSNFKKVAALTSEYDVFINCQYNIYPSLAYKSIFVCHFPHAPLDKVRIPYSNIYKKHLSKLFIHSYDRFIANSPYTSVWLSRYWPGIAKKKIHVITPPVMSVAERTSIKPKKENFIINCGRIDPEKKQLEIAKIFNEHKAELGNYELHIAGTLYQNNTESIEYYKKLKQIASCNEKIKLHVNIGHDELKELYKSSKFYWHGMGYKEDLEANPIKTEHFGISIVEAMTYGCIPIVHNSGGQANIIDEIGLQTKWSTPEEAIKILKTYINNEKSITDTANHVVEASKKYAEEPFAQNIIKELRSLGLINQN